MDLTEAQNGSLGSLRLWSQAGLRANPGLATFQQELAISLNILRPLICKIRQKLVTSSGS